MWDITGCRKCFLRTSREAYLKFFLRCDAKKKHCLLWVSSMAWLVFELRLSLTITYASVVTSNDLVFLCFFTWFSLSDATRNLSQESTWTSAVSVAGTRLHVSQSEEELNGHRLSLNGLLVIDVMMKCIVVIVHFFLQAKNCILRQPWHISSNTSFVPGPILDLC